MESQKENTDGSGTNNTDNIINTEEKSAVAETAEVIENVENKENIAEVKNTGERILRDNKFQEKTHQMLYNFDCIKILECYLKSYRYLFNLLNSIDIASKEYAPIKSIINKNSIFYSTALRLFIDHNSGMHFGKHRVLSNINREITCNIDLVSELIDFSIPLGKVVRLYDPDENVGFY